MYIVDCRGLACPQPVINTKKALENITPGVVLRVIVDNLTARGNVALFAQNAGYSVDVEEKNGEYALDITKKIIDGTVDNSEESNPVPEVVAQCRPDDIVYLITSNLFGQGSFDLSQVLIKSLFVTLNEQRNPPRVIIFLNTGVYLSTHGSPVIDYLMSMAEKGSTVLSCGTCLDYYKLKEKLLVGRISNMYEIIENLSKAGKVITVS